MVRPSFGRTARRARRVLFGERLFSGIDDLRRILAIGVAIPARHLFGLAHISAVALTVKTFTCPDLARVEPPMRCPRFGLEGSSGTMKQRREFSGIGRADRTDGVGHR